MARLTIAWVKEYAKTNGIFLVKTSAGYAVQYQRLIDELTYEDSVGYKECFKTLKEAKNWIDDQDPVDVLGIDKEAAKEIYEDAKKFSDKVDREMGVDREEEVTPLETYVNDVVSREKWILSLTEDELDSSGLSDQEVSFWVKEAKNGGSFTYKLLKSFDDDSRRYFEITYQVFNDQNLVLIDDGFNFNLNYSKDAAKLHALTFLSKGYRGLLWFSDEEIKESMPLTFEEVREYAESIFPYLEITDNKSVYDAIMNWRDSNYFKTPLIKEGEEFLTALPLWELNNSNELNSLKFHKLATEYLAYIERIERKEDMALTKESNAAIRLLVKYDFTTQELTQFEEFALASLKKYVEDGIEPKLIKTFAEVLIKKLSEEEKISLRDKSLKKSLKGNRLDDAKEWFKISDILKKEVEELSNDEIHFLLEFLEKNKHLDIKSVPHSMGGAIYRFDLTCYNWHEVLKDKGFFREALYFKAGYGISHEVFNDLIKEKLKRHIRGVLSEEVFLDMCLREGVDDHEASLKWLEFINLTVDCEMPEKWEESWEEFKESEEFKELI